MRRLRAIAWTTALEVLSEPLCLLITLAALVLAVLAPAFHCHQFGEASRMARDAGFSALLLGGFFFAGFAALKTFRREIESGTMQTALAHSVSPTQFFLAKSAGCALAYAVFFLVVGAVSCTIVNGTEIGAVVAAEKGQLVKIWGPSLACAVAVTVLSIVLAALLNRFARMRFTISVNMLALLIALAGLAYRFNAALTVRLVPAYLLFGAPPLVLLAASAAFAVRFKSHVAATLVAVAAALLVPMLGNYCLSEALARGGSIPVSYFVFALAAIIPAVAAFLALGVHFINGKDAA